MKPKKSGLLAGIGPGLVIAATGVGAGDLVAATVSGARFGTVILWAALVGALLKYSLNEGLARWQLASGETLLEGWASRLPKFVSYLFLGYLVLWSFIVAGALMAACGLAAHAIVPAVSVKLWGVVHAILAAALVVIGRYRWFERTMKFFVGMMFLVILICAVRVWPGFGPVVHGLLVPSLPEGGLVYIMGVIGGVGGSVTLLSYGYWIREKGWQGIGDLPRSRMDLAVAYGLTGCFGIAVMVVAAGIQPEVVSGNAMVLSVAEHLGGTTGKLGSWLFLFGFWGAVFSSMLGVWQGIPYLFDDFVRHLAGKGTTSQTSTQRRNQSAAYRSFLAFLAVPPMVLLWVGKPVWVVVVYAVAGSLFMPFLAATLLYMNNQKAWMGATRNRWPSNSLLVIALLLFLVLFLIELGKRFT